MKIAITLIFLYHLLRSSNIQTYWSMEANSGSVSNLNSKIVSGTMVPVPPIEVQEEIVRVLDSFAELEARRRQYAYYRDSLISPDESWHFCKVIDLLTQPITDGPHETPVFYSEGIPFISAEAIQNNKIDLNKMRGFISNEYSSQCRKKYTPKKDDIFIVKSGSTTGKVAYVDVEPNLIFGHRLQHYV